MALEHLKSISDVKIQIRELPMDDIAEEDRTLVLNVVSLMVTIKYPIQTIKSWVKDQTSDFYYLKCYYPAGVPFSLKDLELIKDVNQVRVNDVWLEAGANEMCLCATVWKHDAPITITTHQIILINSINAKKRQMTD